MDRHNRFLKLPLVLCVITLFYTFTTGYSQTAGISQDITVTGTVSDASGLPLPGVNVLVQRTNIGSATDINGIYSITVPNEDAILVFSYISYITHEQKVGANRIMNITLTENIKEIEEVVVVGYGTQRRSDVTGAVASIKRDELLTTPSSSVGDMLRGRATGVQISAASGRPGATPNILIRGRRSIADGESMPLYIIDGSVSTDSEFNTLNAQDIASIEVLKDAAAQAIYGARAANGVILVTTYRGKSGKTIINLDASVGTGNLWRNFDFFSPKEWMALRAESKSSILRGNEYREASDFTHQEILNDEKMIRSYEDGRTYDWEKLMFSSAVTQKYDLSIRGGSDKLKIATGLGYIDQNGILKFSSGYKRFNLRLNVDYDVNKYLSIGFNSSYMKSNEKRENGTFSQFITRPPFGQVYNENGGFEQFLTSSNEPNPLFRLTHYRRDIITDNSRINGFIDIKPVANLSYRLNVSYLNSSVEDGSYQGSEMGDSGTGGNGSIANSNQQMYLIENILNYTVPFTDTNHKLSLTAVNGYDKGIIKTLGYKAAEVPVDREEGWNMLPDGVVSDPERNVTELLLISFLGRLQYSFKDRYLLTAAIRRDGSSKFGKNNKWGTFPSVALAWRVSEENFIKEKLPISNLKLRTSYGVVGNQNGIPSYTTLGLAESYEMEFGSQRFIGYLPSRILPDPNLKWENTAQLNFGLDFGFFNNRISGSAEYYNTHTKDLLLRRQINAALGYDRIFTNIGETKTMGWEFSLSGDLIRNKDLNWNITTNLSATHNKIISLTGLRDENGKQVDDIVNCWFIDKPIMVYYDYIFDGIFQLNEFEETNVKNVYKLKPTIDSDGDGIPDTTVEYPYSGDGPQPGMVKMKDLNNDGKITPEDDRETISREPKFIYSISSTFNYKNFDLFFDFYGVSGTTILNPYLYSYEEGGALRGRYNGVKMDYWTPTNPSNTFPRPREDGNPAQQILCAYQDASYFRLRTMSLGYTLPPAIFRKKTINKLRLYVTATNVFTMTQFKSYSPEMIQGQYPELRQLLFGLNLSF